MRLATTPGVLDGWSLLTYHRSSPRPKKAVQLLREAQASGNCDVQAYTAAINACGKAGAWHAINLRGEPADGRALTLLQQ